MPDHEETPQSERELLRARLDFLRSPVPPRGSDWTGVALGADRGLGDVVLVRDEEGLGNVLVPVNPSSPGFPGWKRRGVEASVQQVLYRRSIGYYIRVRCTVQGADEAFASMATEIARQLAVAGRPIGEIVLKTLERHAAMFERAAGTIPQSRLLGVLGELLVLRDLALFNSKAVGNWSGPLGGHHDFEFPSDAIEVKTRLASSQGVIHVNGLEQFDIAPGTRLWLVVNEVVEANDGESAADILRQLRSGGAHEEALSERLANYGLTLDDARLTETRYVRRPVEAFEVTPGFPRLVPDSFVNSGLPAGVQNIEYALRVAALTQWRVTEADWRREIGRIAATA